MSGFSTRLLGPEGDALRQAVDQLRELLARRCRDPVKTQAPIGALGVDAVEEQHVKVNVEVQRTAEALHLRDCARARGSARKSRFANQVHGNGTGRTTGLDQNVAKAWMARLLPCKQPRHSEWFLEGQRHSGGQRFGSTVALRVNQALLIFCSSVNLQPRFKATNAL